MTDRIRELRAERDRMQLSDEQIRAEILALKSRPDYRRGDPLAVQLVKEALQAFYPGTVKTAPTGPGEPV